MKPTSLSDEFYKKLYDEIINSDVDTGFDDDEVTRQYMGFEIDNLYVEVRATFDVNFVDDSFDHAFGTEHSYHFEVGNFTDLDDVTVRDDDNNDLSSLFDYDKFWDQDKKYGVTFNSGRVINPGDECLFRINYKWFKGIYRYTAKQTCEHTVELDGRSRVVGTVFPATEENLKNAGIA